MFWGKNVAIYICILNDVNSCVIINDIIQVCSGEQSSSEFSTILCTGILLSWVRPCVFCHLDAIFHSGFLKEDMLFDPMLVTILLQILMHVHYSIVDRFKTSSNLVICFFDE